MADQQDAGLLERADSQASVEVVTNTSRRRSGTSDLKIAGSVFLVCMLIAGQGLTAYFIINQKSQISSLEKTSDLMKLKMSQTSRGGGSSSGKMIHTSMFNAPLMTMALADNDGKKKTPMTKLEDAITISLENQVKDLLQDAQLPQFNQTFLGNLQAMKTLMQELEWKGFESWMHHWLVFQMAQQPPPKPSPTPVAASTLQTKCQLEAGGRARIGFYRPQCDDQGNYRPMQCWHSTGYCWCVDPNGVEIPNTIVRGKALCGGMPVADKIMAMPSLARLMKDE